MRAPSLLVRDLAVHRPVMAKPGEAIVECARRMLAEHVGCLVIVDSTDGIDLPIGMLTDRDITTEVVAYGLDPKAMTASDVMSHELAVVREDDNLLDAVALMREHVARRLPVIGPNGVLLGVIALDSLLEALAEQLDGIIEVLKARHTREVRARP